MAQKRSGGRGRGNGRGNGNGGNRMDLDGAGAGAGSGNYQNNRSDDVRVEFRNWNSSSASDLERFITRKTDYKPHNGRVNGNVYSFWCPRYKLNAMQKLSGQSFGRQTLNVRTIENGSGNGGSGGSAAQTNETRATLEAFLRSRYDPQSLLLNLADMQNDVLLSPMLRTATSPQKVYMALFSVAQMILPEVESVSLENNGLTSVETVLTLADAFPGLKNLSLAGNMLASINSIMLWRNRFKLLRELVLAGNQVASQQHAILEMFPRLVVLDGVIVRDEKTLPPPPGNKLPMPIQARFFENEQVGKLASEFLQHFFFTWDSDRALLAPLYGDISQFSFAVDTESPHLPRALGTFKAYLSGSRNILRMNRHEVESRRLHVGTNSIMRSFRDLPSTKHDLHDPAAFAFDAWQLSDICAPGDAGVIVTVHGSFEDGAAHKRRSFDRTFVLVPGPVAGATLIASDMLALRGECDNSIFHSTPEQPPVPAVPAMAPMAPQSVVSAMSLGPPGMPQPIQPQVPSQADQVPVGQPQTPEQLVQALMAQTRLTAPYADMCLSQSEYDLPRALELFNVSRDRLPPDAFQM